MSVHLHYRDLISGVKHFAKKVTKITRRFLSGISDAGYRPENRPAFSAFPAKITIGLPPISPDDAAKG
jgi:hypothetical protein